MNSKSLNKIIIIKLHQINKLFKISFMKLDMKQRDNLIKLNLMLLIKTPILLHR